MKPTLDQAGKLIELVSQSGRTDEWVQEHLIGSGAFTDLLAVNNLRDMNRDERRHFFGLSPLNPSPKPPLLEPVGTIVIPADGEEFELTLTSEEADPIAMVCRDGYGDWQKWKYKGVEIKGTQTKRCKLVRLGYVLNLDDARQKGRTLVDGQWREAFKKKFSQNDGKGPIGFGGVGSQWVSPDGVADFPVLDGDGAAWYSRFVWAGDGRNGRWRWLAGVSK